MACKELDVGLSAHTYILDIFRSSECCKELRAAQMNQALKTEGGERMHERRQKN